MKDIYWEIDALELCEVYQILLSYAHTKIMLTVVITVTDKKVKGQTVGVLTPFAHYWLAGASQPSCFNGRFSHLGHWTPPYHNVGHIMDKWTCIGILMHWNCVKQIFVSNFSDDAKIMLTVQRL